MTKSRVVARAAAGQVREVRGKPLAKMGRPSKLPSLDLEQIRAMASLGLTDEEIGIVLGVTSRTIIRWKKRPDFRQALNDGKIKADMQVTKSLYQMALGDPSKKIWPNVAAAIFWLKNRKPDRWREKQDVEHGGSVKYDGKLVIEVVETRG